MSEKPFRPMLAGKADLDQLAKIRYPVIASPKIDGVRCLGIDGRPMSRTMKIIPNRHIQRFFAENAETLNGLDGELGVGDPTDPDFYRNTISAVMREDEEPNFNFHVFDVFLDKHGSPLNLPYRMRQFAANVIAQRLRPTLIALDSHRVDDAATLEAYEALMVDKGHEGIMIRDLEGPYKQGRSTLSEGYLLKVKRFLDAEATIIGWEEKMHNGNEATKNALGRTERSSHQENMVPMGTLGALSVRGLTAYEGIIFNIGTGMSDALRAELWASRDNLMGKTVKFKYFATGGKDAPRFPVYLGMRSDVDMDKKETI